MEDGVDNGLQAPKRKRTSLACSRCRRQKLRCSGTKPSCTACVQRAATCDYQDPRLNRVKFVMQKPCKDADPKRNDGPVDGNAPATSLAKEVNTIVVPDKIVEPRSIRIPFFRWFGPTGIAPGYKKMLFDVRHPSQQDAEDPEALPPAEDESKVHTSIRESAAASVFETDGITPAPRVLGPLLDTFFDHYGCHFPFYRRDAFTVLVKDRKVSALVLNSICGLSARFSPLPEFQDYPLYLRGDIFAQKAKVLLVPLLNLPSYDVVASILMLVWLELASNHDVGVWMYMGMACRMAMDLGMHKAAISGPDKLAPEEYWTVSRTWFSVHHLDHIISFATGRPLSIERKYIDVPWPRIDANAALPSPFPSMVVIMQTLGLLHDELNNINQLAELADSTREKLLRYNDELINYYAHLPPALSFDIHNFQSYVATGEGGTYLMLHLWFHAIVIGLHRPGLRYGQEARAKSICLTLESRGIALSSARTITSILNLVEVVDTRTLVSSPFIDQAVEVAGLVFIAESSSTSNPLKRITSRSNYDVCLRTLQRLITYWKGVSWVTTTMEQQAEGIRETDPAEGSVDPHSLIELQDTKMIQKLFEKMRQSMPRRTITKAQESIGVGFSGLTNDSSQGNVMILQPNSPSIGDQMNYTGGPHSAPIGARKYAFSEQHFTSESALIGGESWHSWIDDRFLEDLDLTFETLPAQMANSPNS